MAATTKSTSERIQAKKAEMEQKKHELSLLLQRQKKEERKARNHRICRRGAHLESILPDTISLSDERFWRFLEKTVANDFGRRTLATLIAEQDKEDAKNGADTATNDGGAPTDKPTSTTQSANKSVAPTTAKPPQDGIAASAAKTPGAA